jgi:hypothetical protein
VVVNKDKSCSICSTIEKRAFEKGVIPITFPSD